ncbi:MAG: sialidase family protein, partial [Bacteroidota bacterium]
MTKYKFYLIISFSLLFQSVIPAQNDWQLLGLENLSIEYVFAKGDTIWTGTVDSTYKYSIYYSFTGGVEWSQVTDTSSLIDGWLNLLRVDPNNSLTIYANTFNGRGLKSRNGGKNWEYIFPEAEPWPERTRVKQLYISPHNQNVLFSIVTVSQLDKLYRTTNGGVTWEDLGSFVASSHGNELSFAFDPIDSMRMYIAADDNYLNSIFFASYDFGETWSALSELSNFASKIIVDWNNNNIIYRFRKPYRSIDGGFTW